MKFQDLDTDTKKLIIDGILIQYKKIGITNMRIKNNMMYMDVPKYPNDDKFTDGLSLVKRLQECHDDIFGVDVLKIKYKIVD